MLYKQPEVKVKRENMTRHRGTPGRPPVERDRVADMLCDRIVGAALKPGDRIPTRRDLARELDVSLVTAQQAVARLEEQGFVEARGRRGTFVATEPPHLVRYALVFPSQPGPQGEWNGFWKALEAQAAAVGDTSSCRLRLFHGIDGHTDTRDYRRIVRDIKARRVAGLLLASAPHLIADTPIMTEPGVPRVALMAPANAPPGLSIGEFTDRHYIRAVLDDAVAQGRRRVAVLTVPTQAAAWERALAERAKDGQVETRPHWVQCVAPEHASSARPLMRLLMHAEQQVRPDALAITDDNLVEQATRGLADLGVDVPSQLLVTVHANFPLPSDAHVPVRRIGYDAGRVLDLCIGELNRQRREGGTRRIRIQAQWEEDLTPIFRAGD